MAFLDREKITQANIKKAEDDLTQTLERERPDELGAPKKGEKAVPPATVETPPGDSEELTWKERYGNLQRHIEKNIKPKFKEQIDALTAENTALKQEKENMTRQAAPAQLPKTDDEIEALKSENPAAYNALVKLASGIADEIVQRKVAELESDVKSIKQQKQQIDAEAAFVELAKRHPNLDVFNLDADPLFVEWFEVQPKVVKDALTGQKEDVDSASFALTQFENWLTKKKPKKPATTTTAQAAAAMDVEVNSSPTMPTVPKGFEFSESQIEEMDRVNPRWVEENIEKIEKAAREGRILLDKSDPVGAMRQMQRQNAVAA